MRDRLFNEHETCEEVCDAEEQRKQIHGPPGYTFALERSQERQQPQGTNKKRQEAEVTLAVCSTKNDCYNQLCGANKQSRNLLLSPFVLCIPLSLLL